MINHQCHWMWLVVSQTGIREDTRFFRLGLHLGRFRFRAELTIGPVQRVRVKVTVVEDPQAPLPDSIVHSSLRHAFNKTRWIPHHPPSQCLLSTSISFYSLISLFSAPLVSSSLLLSLSFHARNTWSRLHYHFCAAPSSPPPCFPSPRCLALLRLSLKVDSSAHQDRSLSRSPVLDFQPLLLGQWPASAALLWELQAAVITSGTETLGLPHRWHSGGGVQRGLKRRKGRLSLCSTCDCKETQLATYKSLTSKNNIQCSITV